MNDPLNEFAIEDTSALPAAWPAETRRRSRAPWFLATGTLVLGLLTGLAIGLALTRWSESASEPAANALTDRAGNLDVREEPQPTMGRQPVEQLATALKGTEVALRDAPVPAPPLQAEAPPAPRGHTTPREQTNTVPLNGPALLYVQSRPQGAQVHLDGGLVSTTPFQISGLSPGAHTVRIEMPGYKSWSTSIQVDPGARIRLSASLEQ